MTFNDRGATLGSGLGRRGKFGEADTRPENELRIQSPPGTIVGSQLSGIIPLVLPFLDDRWIPAVSEWLRSSAASPSPLRRGAYHAGSQSNVPLERGNEVPDLRCLREQVVDTLL